MSKRILVLEDEAIVAMDIAASLKEAGWEVVGPAASIDDAKELAQEKSPKAALFDINLGGKNSFELAVQLREQGVDVVFLTGYAPSALPDELAQCAIITKPVSMAHLIETLDGLVES